MWERASGIKPIERRAAVTDVVVDVDESGSDVETGDIDDFSGGGGGNIFLRRRRFFRRIRQHP